MFGGAKAKKRFSLVLLDEGEYYFDDYSAFYYPAASTDEESVRRKVKGRVLVCSSSVLFDPDDISIPISKFPFKDMQSIQQYHCNSVYSPLSKLELFAIRANLVVEMKENNTNTPYKFKKAPGEYRFSLNYVDLGPILSRLSMLHQISKLPRNEFDNIVKGLIEERESKAQFDHSWLVDLNEKQLAEVIGARVTPLVVNPGRILITNRMLYFQPMNNIEATPVNQWKLENIIRVSKRRHGLREVGIEMFMEDNSSLFFIFQSVKERNNIYELITNLPELSRLQSNEQSNMTLKWQNGIISNFDYLMYLNFLAGRTFNDLTQYPVFPWVVADYDSKTLDLTKPTTFRDLTKPIGALTPSRLAMFKERYEQIPDGQPKFLYGTHYSAPAYVLYYLVRQVPEYMLRLQNGRFDAADRMFHSIEETWSNVLNNPTDVKELIPEFYKPNSEKDFLLNTEGLDMGSKQNAVRLGDVVLPPWAKDSRDFVAKLREALECDYVSENLHNWIDLIFGYKQQGAEAIKADNVFYHLTYEGAVDMENITDPMERASLEAQINEFGQCPKKCFDVVHPKRLPKALRTKTPILPEPVTPASTTTNSSSSSNNYNTDFIYNSPMRNKQSTETYPVFNNTNQLYSTYGTNSNTYEITQDLGSLHIQDYKTNSSSNNNTPKSSSGITETGRTFGKANSAVSPQKNEEVLNLWGDMSAISLDFTMKLHKDAITAICLSSNLDTVYSVSQDTSLKIYSISEKRQLRSVNLCGLSLSSCQLAPDEKSIIIGSWDNNIYFYSVDYGRVSETVSAHDDAVSCLCMKGENLVSGSWDSTVKLWKIRPSGIGKVPAADFIDSETEIKCVDISPRGDAAVSGSDDGNIMIYDLRSQELVRTVQSHIDGVSTARFTPDGSRVVTCSDDQHIKVLELRGAEIISLDAREPLKALDTDGATLFAGGEAGVVRVWDMTSGSESGELECDVTNEAISYITVSPKGDVMASGTVAGSLSLWRR